MKLTGRYPKRSNVYDQSITNFVGIASYLFPFRSWKFRNKGSICLDVRRNLFHSSDINQLEKYALPNLHHVSRIFSFIISASDVRNETFPISCAPGITMRTTYKLLYIRA